MEIGMQVKQHTISYSGQENPVNIIVPNFNGRPASEISIGVAQMSAGCQVGIQLSFSVMNVRIQGTMVDVYSVKGSQHNLLLTLQKKYRENHWDFSDSLCESVSLGKTHGFQFAIYDEKEKLIDLKNNDIWLSFRIMMMCNYK